MTDILEDQLVKLRHERISTGPATAEMAKLGVNTSPVSEDLDFIKSEQKDSYRSIRSIPLQL